MLFLNKLWATLAVLAVTLTMVGGLHFLMLDVGSRYLAARLAPEYVVPNPDEANALHAEYIRQVKENLRNYEANCEAGQLYDSRSWGNPNWMSECRQRKLQEIAEYRHPPLSVTYSNHAQAYQQREIEPRLENLRKSILPRTFGAIYALIALVVLYRFLSWFIRNVFPPLRQKARNLSDLARRLWYRSTVPSLDRVARDITNLTTLFENGLIAEDDFLKRKAALRTAAEQLSKKRR